MTRAIPITFFSDVAATIKRQEYLTKAELVQRLERTHAPTKALLPLLKLATFGEDRTALGSYRHNANVLACSGCECDYDQCRISFGDAIGTLREAGVAAVIATSPSHRTDAPRWRLLCAFSKVLPPAARETMVGRLNGLFQGNLAGESFTLSQAFYVGRVDGNPAHRVAVVDGTSVDLRPDLDAGAVGRKRSGLVPSKAVSTIDRPVDPDLMTMRRWKVLEIAIAKVRAAQTNKHETLLKSGYLIGGLIADLNISVDAACGMLADALCNSGPNAVKDWAAARSTAAYAVQSGTSRKLELEDRPYGGRP